MDAPDTRPIYQTIAADLRERITGGRLRVGERLPSETELCRDYGVSRMTVRQALSSLQASGLLLRRQGKGTFVASTKGERSASRLLGFEEDTISRGLTPGSTVLASGWGELDAEAQLLLDRSGPEPAFLVDRLRTVNDEPIGINRIILLEKWARLLEDSDFSGSLYRIINRKLNDEAVLANQRIEAVAATAEQSRLLGIMQQQPLLRITRTTHTASNGVIGLTRTLYRGDRYYLSLTVTRGEDGAPE